MKMKKLTTAVIMATLTGSSGIAMAAGSHTITTNIPNMVVGMEAFGEYTNISNDFSNKDFPAGTTNSENSNDSTNFEGTRLRLNVEADVKADVIFRAELEWDPDNTSNTVTNDLYLQKNHGDWTYTLGRQKQSIDAENEVELADRPFSSASSSFSQLGTMRRIDGGSIRWHNGGFHGGLNVYKEGSKFESNTNTTGGFSSVKIETDFDLGYGLRGGWLGSIGSGIQLGASLSYFNDAITASKFSTNGVTTTSFKNDRMGYGIETIVKTGPFLGGFNYSNGEEEEDTGGTSPLGTEDTDASAFTLWGVWNIKNADRQISPLGVTQGPVLAAGQHGYEVGLRIAQYEHESDEFNGSGIKTDTFDTDIDSLTLAFNAYCGEFVKWYVEYEMVDNDTDHRDNAPSFTTGENTEFETDTFRIGARVRF